MYECMHRWVCCCTMGSNMGGICTQQHMYTTAHTTCTNTPFTTHVAHTLIVLQCKVHTVYRGEPTPLISHTCESNPLSFHTHVWRAKPSLFTHTQHIHALPPKNPTPPPSPLISHTQLQRSMWSPSTSPHPMSYLITPPPM